MTSFPSVPTFDAVRRWYAAGADMEEGLAELARRIRRESAPGVWISLVPEQDVRARARILKEKSAGLDVPDLAERYPLFGIPFAVKDNMDVTGMKTTAACPAYAYKAERTAFVVQKLLDAGAVLMGKTNLDQFATGLVGVRSPYGACPNSFNPEYISGGSSSGSAHAVARGLVSFSLGTDTAGSIRVPAALNNLIGLKPSRGLLSSSGVVPACPSLDCVSILALTSEDAADVLRTAGVPDPDDIWSRAAPERPSAPESAPFTFGIPDTLNFFGNKAWERAWEKTVENMCSIGGRCVSVRYAPYEEAADMLYFGPYMAERTAVLGEFIRTHTEDCVPVVRDIILGAGRWSAEETFRTLYRARELRRMTAADFERMDLLLLPTVPTTYTIEEVRRDPMTTNVNMSRYTNFMNILDLCAVSVPAAMARMPGTHAKLPFGVTMAAPAFSEKGLLSLASRLHSFVQKRGLPLGACLQ